ELSGDLHPFLHGAKYEAGGKITLHNDAMQWVVRPQDVIDDQRYPAGTPVFRKIALIYYLTQDWSEDFGGCFVDNMEDGPRAVVPEFNSLVVFLVPREHWVSEMLPGAPSRYSLFGWLHDTEPYPQGALQPLGTGNRRKPEAGQEALSSPSEMRRGLATSSLATKSTGLANEAREHCEHGFRMRFGIDRKDLRLGNRDSAASALLRRLGSGGPA
ncbi:unnamed protein product, partial [Polarella glacialis]